MGTKWQEQYRIGNEPNNGRGNSLIDLTGIGSKTDSRFLNADNFLVGDLAGGSDYVTDPHGQAGEQA